MLDIVLATISTLTITLLLLSRASHRWYTTRSRLPYPPTPPGRLILENLDDLMTQNRRDRYLELSNRHGEIFHLSSLGKHTIIVNSQRVADELFNRRSQIYSDRQDNTMANLMDWGRIGATFLRYGPTWRAHRRLFQQGFNASIVQESCHPILSEKIDHFLFNLLTRPEELKHHTEILLGSVILKYVYGHTIDSSAIDDPMFAAATVSARNVMPTVLPGSYLVNSIPVLQRLPEWFPGCYFHTFARVTKEITVDLMESSYADALKHTENPSLVALLEEYMRNHPSQDTNVEVAKGVCVTAYSAAAETTDTTLSIFFLLMREHPHIQLKAYEEITSVIGRDRLPEFNDRPALPYVQAVYLEVMRWMPAVPFGTPHTTSQDDVYDGYFIPKGSMVMGNIWAMMNNETEYPEPRTFRPERFLTPDGKLTGSIDVKSLQNFGFGRRVCPGRHFADALVWRAMACVLAAFFVGSPKEESHGFETLKKLEKAFAQGIFAHPPAYKCTFTPRTEAMADVIRAQKM